MSAILDIPEVRQRISRLSVDDYHRLGEFNAQCRRTELIRGIVIETISSPRFTGPSYRASTGCSSQNFRKAIVCGRRNR